MARLEEVPVVLQSLYDGVSRGADVLDACSLRQFRRQVQREEVAGEEGAGEEGAGEEGAGMITGILATGSTATAATAMATAQTVDETATKNKTYTYQEFVQLITNKRTNGLIDPLHATTVHQDMTHPLSHYFICSSHNTYCSGDQVGSINRMHCLSIDCAPITPITHPLHTHYTPITHPLHTHYTLRIPSTPMLLAQSPSVAHWSAEYG
jgi:hypothetical protein